MNGEDQMVSVEDNVNADSMEIQAIYPATKKLKPSTPFIIPEMSKEQNLRTFSSNIPQQPKQPEFVPKAFIFNHGNLFENRFKRIISKKTVGQALLHRGISYKGKNQNDQNEENPSGPSDEPIAIVTDAVYGDSRKSFETRLPTYWNWFYEPTGLPLFCP